ncbi:MAG: RecX family transcriptional regulator [Clostridia bacterium]|nr:RecX family transcriptional regulator [Clostridia bacterium]
MKNSEENRLNEITAITPQVKDKRRCNIYVDGRFYCGLTLEATVKNRLKVGQIVEPSKLAEIQLESEENTAFDKALTHLSATWKTEKQVREFLSGKGYLSVVIDHVIEKLRSYKFLDDGVYAENYVESAAKRKGGRLIRMELRGKGVSDEEIDAALENLDEEKEVATATAILQKYMRGKIADQPTLQKAFRYLMGKGFDYEVAKQALSAFGNEQEEF